MTRNGPITYYLPITNHLSDVCLKTMKLRLFESRYFSLEQKRDSSLVIKEKHISYRKSKMKSKIYIFIFIYTKLPMLS